MQGPDEIGELLEKGNPFGEFFEHLSNAIFTGQAKDEDDEEPVTECFTAASSQEIQPEIYSELALKAFIKAIVKSMGSKISPKWKIAVYVVRTQVRLTTRLWVGIPLEPKKALSDGGIVLSTFTTNGYTPEDIPI